MNRVIRNPDLGGAAQFFGSGEPRFVDGAVAEMIDRARREGHHEGYASGVAEGRSQLEGVAQRLQTALEAAAEEIARTHRESVTATVELALEVAEFAIERAPHDAGAAIAERIVAAVGQLDGHDAVVSVQSADWDAVSSALEATRGISIERDEALLPGEARIQSDWAFIDLTREAAFAVVREVMS